MGSGTDAFDEVLVEDGFAPCIHGCLLQFFVFGIGSITPEVAFEVVPQVFDGIEFGTVGGRRHERNIVGDAERFAGVEAGSIPDHHGMLIRGNRGRKLLQENVDDRRIELRTEQSFGMPRLGTNGAQYPQILVLRLTNGRRSRSLSSPDIGEGTLLAETRFVSKVDSQPLLRMILGNRSQQFTTGLPKRPPSSRNRPCDGEDGDASRSNRDGAAGGRPPPATGRR